MVVKQFSTSKTMFFFCFVLCLPSFMIMFGIFFSFLLVFVFCKEFVLWISIAGNKTKEKQKENQNKTGPEKVK